jgi:excisionase family DNA binding protein
MLNTHQNPAVEVYPPRLQERPSSGLLERKPRPVVPECITTPEPLMNDAQAAQFLGGLHPKTVQRMARHGEIPSYRIGKYWRYRASELSEWLVLHSSGQINPPAHTREETQ